MILATLLLAAACPPLHLETLTWDAFAGRCLYADTSETRVTETPCWSDADCPAENERCDAGEDQVGGYQLDGVQVFVTTDERATAESTNYWQYVRTLPCWETCEAWDAEGACVQAGWACPHEHETWWDLGDGATAGVERRFTVRGVSSNKNNEDRHGPLGEPVVTCTPFVWAW